MSESTPHDQELGNALAAHLIGEAALQYRQHLLSACQRSPSHPHTPILLATFKALGVASTLAQRAFDRTAKRAQERVSTSGNGQEAEEATRQFMTELTQLAHLHLESGGN